MQKRPLLVLAALAAACEPDLGRGVLEKAKTGLRESYAKDPIGSTVSTVIVASWLFYRAERGKNATVHSFYDALEYVTSSLSVGYSKTLPETEEGKLIASAIMTVGPGMAAGLLDEKRGPKEDVHQAEMLDRLDRILAALEARS